MAAQLNDDVWSRLDPSAARLSSRARKGATLVVITLTALVFASVQIGLSGVIVPRIERESSGGGSFEYGEKSSSLANRYHTPVTTHVSQGISIRNNSWYPLEIVGVGADQPGMRVERVVIGSTHFDAERGMWRAGGTTLTASDPYLLPPGESLGVTVHYDITDCRVVSASPQPVPVRVQRWYGRQSVEISLPPLRPYRQGGWSVSSPDDPKAVQWQRFLADHVCEIPYPDGLE